MCVSLYLLCCFNLCQKLRKISFRIPRFSEFVISVWQHASHTGSVLGFTLILQNNPAWYLLSDTIPLCAKRKHSFSYLNWLCQPFVYCLSVRAAADPHKNIILCRMPLNYSVWQMLDISPVSTTKHPWEQINWFMRPCFGMMKISLVQLLQQSSKRKVIGLLMTEC